MAVNFFHKANTFASSQTCFTGWDNRLYTHNMISNQILLVALNMVKLVELLTNFLSKDWVSNRIINMYNNASVVLETSMDRNIMMIHSLKLVYINAYLYETGMKMVFVITLRFSVKPIGAAFCQKKTLIKWILSAAFHFQFNCQINLAPFQSRFTSLLSVSANL